MKTENPVVHVCVCKVGGYNCETVIILINTVINDFGQTAQLTLIGNQVLII